MSRAAIDASPRQFHSFSGHFLLGQAAAPGDAFRGMTVTVTRDKIHLAVAATRIAQQRLLDDAQGLHKLPPIHRTQHPQTANAVTDGNLVGSLMLIF